jgi:hypothetical protein
VRYLQNRQMSAMTSHFILSTQGLRTRGGVGQRRFDRLASFPAAALRASQLWDLRAPDVPATADDGGVPKATILSPFFFRLLSFSGCTLLAAFDFLRSTIVAAISSFCWFSTDAWHGLSGLILIKTLLLARGGDFKGGDFSGGDFNGVVLRPGSRCLIAAGGEAGISSSQ